MPVPVVYQTALRLLQPFAPLWRFLFEPPAHILDPAQRWQARLLNYLLLPIFASLIVLNNWSASPTHYALYFAVNLGVIALSTLLNRAGYYPAAAWAVSALVSASGFVIFGIREMYALSVPELALMRVVPAILIAYLLLPLRGLVLLAAANTLGVVVVALVGGGRYEFIFTILFFTLITSVLAGIAALSRRRYLEQIEQQASDLRESEARYRTLLDAAFETVIVYQNGAILDANPAVEGLLGYAPREVIGKSVREFIDPPYEAQFGDDDPVEGDAPFQIQLRHKNGSALRAEVRSKWHWHQGKSVRVITIRDITELKHEEELRVEREKVVVLQKFIGNLSHDLRTPLSVVNTSIYLIDRLATNPERQRQQIDVLRQQTGLMQRLLEDLISMSRLDKAESENFNFRWANINEPISDAVRDHQNLALRKNQTLCTQLATDLPNLLIDLTEFKRAIKHLILNGLSYSEEGGIVTVETETDQTSVIVRVRDNGIGIEPEELPFIFEHFYRADEARGGAGGTGIGLTIARRIIEAHGGSISVESQPNQGSVFTILLPVRVR